MLTRYRYYILREDFYIYFQPKLNLKISEIKSWIIELLFAIFSK